MYQMVRPAHVWANDDFHFWKMNRCIAEMMSLVIRPFTVVDDTSFRNMMSYVCPNYCMPHRTFFSEKEISKLYNEIRAALKVKLSAIKDMSPSTMFSVTTDVWTEQYTQRAFPGITCHWIYR